MVYYVKQIQNEAPRVQQEAMNHPPVPLHLSLIDYMVFNDISMLFQFAPLQV